MLKGDELFKSLSLLVGSLKSLYEIPSFRQTVTSILQIHQGDVPNEQNVIFSLFNYCQTQELVSKSLVTHLMTTIVELMYSIISHEHFLFDPFPNIYYLKQYLGINENQCLLKQAKNLLFQIRC